MACGDNRRKIIFSSENREAIVCLHISPYALSPKREDMYLLVVVVELSIIASLDDKQVLSCR